MKSMSELVSGVRTGNAKNSKAKEYAHASEWPKCSLAGCPLPATIKGASVTCGHHYGEHGLSADCITEAIKEFLPYINKHNEMIYWDVKHWKQIRNQIMGWNVLPATEEEMNFPSMYISRLRKFIDMGIKEKGNEIYNSCS